MSEKAKNLAVEFSADIAARAAQLPTLAAREAWQIDATERTYYYVLDDTRVRLGIEDGAAPWIEETVAEVAAGIQAQAFEPTPSFATCAMCEYRIACPAAEK